MTLIYAIVTLNRWWHILIAGVARNQEMEKNEKISQEKVPVLPGYLAILYMSVMVDYTHKESSQ